MSREEWLRHGIELVDQQIFNGSLNLEKHKDFQIACGWTKGQNALGETIFPYDGEDVTLDDFFPVTIHVNCTVKDPVEMIEILVHESIHAFFDIKRHGNGFSTKAKEVGFEKPYTKLIPSQWLRDNCESIYSQLKEQYGDFPGKAITIHKKEGEEKPRKSNIIKFFCPECGYEMKTSRMMFEKHNCGLPTCVCGTKMGQDLEENKESENEQNS
jgi:hypothetical protein